MYTYKPEPVRITFWLINSINYEVIDNVGRNRHFRISHWHPQEHLVSVEQSRVCLSRLQSSEPTVAAATIFSVCCIIAPLNCNIISARNIRPYEFQAHTGQGQNLASSVLSINQEETASQPASVYSTEQATGQQRCFCIYIYGTFLNSFYSDISIDLVILWFLWELVYFFVKFHVDVWLDFMCFVNRFYGG